MFTFSDGLSRPPFLVLVLAITLMLSAGGGPFSAVTASNVDDCHKKTFFYYNECTKKAYKLSGVQTSDNHDGGDNAINDLIHGQMNNTCNAKLKMVACFVDELCAIQNCTFNMVEAAEKQMMKDLDNFKDACKWNNQDLKEKRCTEDVWKEKHGIVDVSTTTEGASEAVNYSSISSTVAPLKKNNIALGSVAKTSNSTTFPDSEASTFNSTATSIENNTAVSFSNASFFSDTSVSTENSTFVPNFKSSTLNSTATRVDYNTAVSYSNASSFSDTSVSTENSTFVPNFNSSTFNSTGTFAKNTTQSGNSSITTPGKFSTGGMNFSSTAFSIFESLKQKEVIFIAVSCLVVLLFCCIYCCFCARK